MGWVAGVSETECISSPVDREQGNRVSYPEINE